MAKTVNRTLEQKLWDSFNKLRNKVEPSQYKNIVLPLIFLKYANDRFKLQQEKLIAQGMEQFLEMKPFYNQDNVFYIPEEARWDYIMENAKQNDIAIKIDTAMKKLENENKSYLQGALPDNEFSRTELPVNILSSLLDTVDSIKMKDENSDVFGRVYEYCLLKFAMLTASEKGEFYTPETVVKLMVDLIEPYKGIVYDGACGSGGMFVNSEEFVKNHNGHRNDISIYGQEITPATYKLAKMNMAIHGISAKLGDGPADTFLNDQHPDLKADYALMNPPFNLRAWRETSQLTDDSRWKGYTVPPVNNANYAWILNMLSHLGEDGVGALILAKGALTTEGKEEKAIRKQLIENDLIEAVLVLPEKLFYSTGIGVAIFIFNKNKNRKGETLFLDLTGMTVPIDRNHSEIPEESRIKVAKTFHNWRNRENYEDVPGFSKSARVEDIVEKDYVLTPNQYIELKLEEDDGVPFKEKMAALTTELFNLFEESNSIQEQIKSRVSQFLIK